MGEERIVFMEQGFVYIDEAAKGIRWDAKYATWDNFTGKPVEGYASNRIVGTEALGKGIAKAQEMASSLGYGLLLWDGYRPSRAVESFLHWAGQPEQEEAKQRYYPNIHKADLIRKGYIAERSAHSRGGTVDLTLYNKMSGELVPMGGGFDFMDVRSHHDAGEVSPKEAENRRLLRSIMEASGFVAYPCEWWHYTLKEEPYPDTYFNFPVE